MDDAYFYAGAIGTAAAYAYGLERTNRAYEPDFTWVTVVAGVALTGGWCAARLAYGRPVAGDAADGAWWMWWLTVRMFVATGTPVVAWQLWQARKRLHALHLYLRNRRDDETQGPAALAEGGRVDAAGGDAAGAQGAPPAR